MSTLSPNPQNSTPDSPPSQNPSDSKLEDENQEVLEEEEEEGECGFCLFMKGGGCRDSFIAWEKCVEEAEKNKEDIANKCVEITAQLRICMEAHSDYYDPILRAEKAAEKQFVDELEKEAEKEKIADQSGSESEESSKDSGKEELASNDK